MKVQDIIKENNETREFAHQGYRIKFTPTQLTIFKGGDVALTRPGDFLNPTRQQLSIAKGFVDKLWQKEKEERKAPNIDHQHNQYGIKKEYEKIRQDISKFLEPFEKERADLRDRSRTDSSSWIPELKKLQKKYYNNPEYKKLLASHEEILSRMKKISKGNSWKDINSESFQLEEGVGDWIEKKMDQLLNPYNNHNYSNRPDAVAGALKKAPPNLPDDVAEKLIAEFLKKKEHEVALAQAARAQGTTVDKIKPYLKYFVGEFVDRWRRIPAKTKQDFWKDLAMAVFRLIMFILQAMAKSKR